MQVVRGLRQLTGQAFVRCHLGDELLPLSGPACIVLREDLLSRLHSIIRLVEVIPKLHGRFPYLRVPVPGIHRACSRTCIATVKSLESQLQALNLEFYL